MYFEQQIQTLFESTSKEKTSFSQIDYYSNREEINWRGYDDPSTHLKPQKR